MREPEYRLVSKRRSYLVVSGSRGHRKRNRTREYLPCSKTTALAYLRQSMNYQAVCPVVKEHREEVDDGCQQQFDDIS